MNIFPAFQTILYTMSTALLYPVVGGLILLSLWILVYTGGFMAEWVKRKRFKKGARVADLLDTIRDRGRLPDRLNQDLPWHVGDHARTLELLIKTKDDFLEEKIEDLNQEKHQTLLNEVDKIRLVVRIGPSLGLMGTLIPMGTGLAGLAKGDMAQLSSSLILAFTTTVVGLGLGVLAHFFTVVKEGWALWDMRQINLITEAMARHPQKGEAHLSDRVNNAPKDQSQTIIRMNPADQGRDQPLMDDPAPRESTPAPLAEQSGAKLP